MKVEEVYDEMGTSDSHLAHLQQADNPEYEVVVDAESEGCPDGDMVPVRSIRWDHQEHKMVIEL